MRGFLENAIILFGPNMFNNVLPLWTEIYLQEQITNFPIAIAELNKTASFQVNWRMTQDPKIEEGILDLGMWFDVGPEASYCSLP
jgi:hypothetical protein